MSSAVFTLLISCVTAICPTSSSAAIKQDSSEFREWDSAKLYNRAFGLVRSGRFLERAARMLEIAADKAPSNVDYRLALASAYAGRFASVALAMAQSDRYKAEIRRYESERRKWAEVQSNPAHPCFGMPEPAPPSRPVTIDDTQPFTKTREESLEKLVDLGSLSVGAFDKAIAAAEKGPAEVRARAAYVRGWGLFLLWRFGRDVVRESAVGSHSPAGAKNETERPRFIYLSTDDFVRSFRAACQLELANADYMHSLGIALVHHLVDPTRDSVFARYDDGGAIHSVATITESVELLQKAISLKRASSNLEYQAGLIASALSPRESIPHLEKAARALSNNATLWYVLAYQHIRAAHASDGSKSEDSWRRSLTAIDSGNRAPQYAQLAFSVPAPEELRKAWDFVPAYGFGEDVLVLMNLGMALADRIRASIEKNGDNEIVRTIPSLMGMGLRAIGSFNLGDLDQRKSRGRVLNSARLKWGVIYCGEAYSLLTKAHSSRPDQAKAKLLATYQVFTDKTIRPLNDYLVAAH